MENAAVQNGETFEQALGRFMKAVSEHKKEQLIKQFGQESFDRSFADETFSAEIGKRYVKIVLNVRGGRSVYCFVEIATGLVYKSASWRAPAKHPRGTIYATEFSGYGVSQYGGIYPK